MRTGEERNDGARALLLVPPLHRFSRHRRFLLASSGGPRRNREAPQAYRQGRQVPREGGEAVVEGDKGGGAVKVLDCLVCSSEVREEGYGGEGGGMRREEGEKVEIKCGWPRRVFLGCCKRQSFDSCCILLAPPQSYSIPHNKWSLKYNPLPGVGRDALAPKMDRLQSSSYVGAVCDSLSPLPSPQPPRKRL